MLCKVTTLDHEVLDDAMKGRVDIAWLFCFVGKVGCGERVEIRGGLGYNIAIQTNHNPAQWFATVFNVKVDLSIIFLF